MDYRESSMHLIQTLIAGDIQGFFFDWYPVFGVFFMFSLLLVFVTLLRSTVGSTKPETVKAARRSRSSGRRSRASTRPRTS